MQVKLDLNTCLTAAVLGLSSWIFTTVQSVDKSMTLIEYRVEEMAGQTFHKDCAFCNHALHGQLEEWGK